MFIVVSQFGMFSLLMKSFSYMTKKTEQEFKHLKNERSCKIKGEM